jgi:hypothetical protein
MILSEREDIDTWLDFASICRTGGNTALAERVLTMAQQRTNTNSSSEEDAMDRRIQLAMMKLKWEVKDRVTAVAGLEKLIKKYMQKPPPPSVPSMLSTFSGSSFSGGQSLLRSPSSAFGSSIIGGFGGDAALAAGGLQINSTTLLGGNVSKSATAFGAFGAHAAFGANTFGSSNAFGVGLTVNNPSTSAQMDPNMGGGLHIVNPSTLQPHQSSIFSSSSGSLGVPIVSSTHNVYYSPRTSDCLSGLDIKWIYENASDARVLLKSLLTMGEWKISMLPPNETIDTGTRRLVQYLGRLFQLMCFAVFTGKCLTYIFMQRWWTLQAIQHGISGAYVTIRL